MINYDDVMAEVAKYLPSELFQELQDLIEQEVDDNVTAYAIDYSAYHK